MTTDGASTRPGGRTARIRTAVLAAAREVLVESGQRGLTIDAVAERSGVHRTTIYRRWREPGMLVLELMRDADDDGWSPPDTGSLSGDLVALNQGVLAALTAEPPLDVALISAAFASPAAEEAVRELWAGRYRRGQALIERAVARGEVPAGVAGHRLLLLATGPLYHQHVLLGLPVTPEDAEAYALAAVPDPPHR